MRARRLYRLILWCISPFFRLAHPIRVVGREHIPEGSAVICPNHTAMSDPIFVCLAFGGGHWVRPMAKIEILRWPLVGPVLAAAGIIGVERGKADMKAAKAALRCLMDGNKLLIFPEGTRVTEDKEVEAKGGAAFFACKTGAPILPVYVPARKPWFRPTTVVIGAPFRPEFEGRRATAPELEQFTDETMARVYALEGAAL